MESNLKVKLLRHTPNPDELVTMSAKLCYSPVGVEEIEKDLTDEKIRKFINMLMDMGHESPIEHVNFTFAVEGVSRVLTHQLVRHRIGCSYSQQSQRYVKLDQFEYIIPPAIENDVLLKKEFIKKMNQDNYAYDYFVKSLMINGRTEKQAIEDARYVFPNACETKIVFTMNARALLNFFKLRCCNRAQWEIRQLADEMLRQVKKVAPNLFKFAGATCMNDKCPEGKMACGVPRRSEEYV